MADLIGGIFDGAAGAEALVINAIANEAIKIGSPVVFVAPASGEIFPRVAHPAAATDEIIGVVVGGDNNGIWVDGSTTNDGDAAAAAGEVVKVCTQGRCKVRVKADGTNITAGADQLTYQADGFADVATATDWAFAVALTTATGATDAILCYVNPTGIKT